VLSRETFVCCFFNTSFVSYADIANIVTPGTQFFVRILIDVYFTSSSLTNTLQARVFLHKPAKNMNFEVSLSLRFSRMCHKVWSVFEVIISLLCSEAIL
jgi:hypothetical protein